MSVCRYDKCFWHSLAEKVLQGDTDDPFILLSKYAEPSSPTQRNKNFKKQQHEKQNRNSFKILTFQIAHKIIYIIHTCIWNSTRVSYVWQAASWFISQSHHLFILLVLFVARSSSCRDIAAVDADTPPPPVMTLLLPLHCSALGIFIPLPLYRAPFHPCFMFLFIIFFCNLLFFCAALLSLSISSHGLAIV